MAFTTGGLALWRTPQGGHQGVPLVNAFLLFSFFKRRDFPVGAAAPPPLAWIPMVSNKPWSLEAAARLFLTIIVSLFCGLCVSGLADALKPPWSPETRDLAEMVIMTVFLHGAALVWTGLFLRQQALSWREAFFKRAGGWRAAGLGLAVGAVSAPALVLVQDGLTALARKYWHWNL